MFSPLLTLQQTITCETKYVPCTVKHQKYYDWVVQIYKYTLTDKMLSSYLIMITIKYILPDNMLLFRSPGQ